MLKKIKLLFGVVFLSLSFLTVKAQDEITLELTTNVTAAINAEKATLDALKNDLCKQVDALSYDVTKLGNGSLSYPNWVRFVQIAEQIEDLNETWNEAYGNALNNIIQTAIDEGQISDDERSKDLLSDIIEENHLVYPGDMASVCYETKFDFTSLRKCMEDQENTWLDQSGEDFNAGNSPTLVKKLMMKCFGL